MRDAGAAPQRVLDCSRIAVLDLFEEALPCQAGWDFGMDEADEPTRGLDLDGDRQLAEFGDEVRAPVGRQRAPPLHSVVAGHVFDRRRIGLAVGIKVEEHVLVVAAHGVDPWRAQEAERPLGGGATIDGVADAEQAVARWIEASLPERLQEDVERSVQVAADEVAAGRVREDNARRSLMCLGVDR